MAEFGRLGLLVGLAVHAVVGAAWMEGAHGAAAWSRSLPSGWYQDRRDPTGSTTPWASAGPLRPTDADFLIGRGQRWVPRQPGLTQQPGTLAATLTVPDGGWVELWAARPREGQPAQGGVGVEITRGLVPGVRVVRSGADGLQRLPCSDQFPAPGDDPVALTITPGPDALSVQLDGVQAWCQASAYGHPPAVVAGSINVGVSGLALDGRTALPPAMTPAPVRWLLGGALACGLFLAEGMLGIGAVASILATLPAALTFPLSLWMPEQLAAFFGMEASGSLAWTLPLALCLLLRVCIHAHHRLCLPPAGRDWPAAAPLAMALLGSLGWGARGDAVADLVAVGVALVLSIGLAMLIPLLLRRAGRPQPLRTTTWMMAPVGMAVLLGGIGGAGALTMLGGLLIGVGAGVLVAVLPGRLPRGAALLTVLALPLGGELALRGLEHPTAAPLQAPAMPPLHEEVMPGQPLLAGPLLVGGGHGPHGRGILGDQPVGTVSSVPGRVSDLLDRTEAALDLGMPSAVVISLAPDALVSPRGDLHEARRLGSMLLARFELVGTMLIGQAPAEVSPDALHRSLSRIADRLGDRPLIIILAPGPTDAGAAWPWVRALQDLAETRSTVRIVDISDQPGLATTRPDMGHDRRVRAVLSEVLSALPPTSP